MLCTGAHRAGMAAHAVRLRLAALCLLLSSAALVGAAEEVGGAQGGQAASGGAVGGDAAPASSLCNPGSAATTTTPFPCTPEQELDALSDLNTELPDVDDPTESIIDSSSCNATDPEGFTVAVDLFDPDLAEVSRAGRQVGRLQF